MHTGFRVGTVDTKIEKYIRNLCIHLDKMVSLFQVDLFYFTEKVILQLSTRLRFHCDGHTGWRLIWRQPGKLICFNQDNCKNSSGNS